MAGHEDGTAPGGARFPLFSTISNQNMLMPFRKVTRRFIDIRLPTGYVDFNGTARVWTFLPHFLDAKMNLDFGLNIAFTGHKMRLSNLLITNDAIGNSGGTLISTTTFNDNPYCVVFVDKTNAVRQVANTSQYNTAADATASSWTLSDIQERDTYTNLSGALQQQMEATIWKQGDNAIEYTGKPYPGRVKQPTDDTQTTYLLPYGNHRTTNYFPYEGNTSNTKAAMFPAPSTLFMGICKIPGAQGDLKFSASFLLEEEVSGVVQIVDDGNQSNDGLYIRGVYESGTQRFLSGDVRSVFTGSRITTDVI